MSTASSALPGKPSLGGLLARIIFIVILWAALVAGTLHYVGYVWPKAYQISLAEKEEADEKAQSVFNAPATPAPSASAISTAAAPAAPKATSSGQSAAAPTASATSAAPAAASSSTSASAAPTKASASAASSAPAPAPAAGSVPKAASGEQPLPHDLRLAGYNRTALENVSIFFSIVISVFCVGAILLQIFKYKHVEEEAAH